MTSASKHSNAGIPKGSLRFSFVLALSAILMGMVQWGCGYTRVRPGTNLPPEIRRIAVPTFRNDTFESGVEVLMTDAFREQIARSKFVKLVSVENSDAVFVGTIKKFSLRAISFSEGDFAVEYRVSIKMRLKLVSRQGKTLWEDRNLSRVEEYRVSPDIFQSEAARQKATQQIADKLMADVHDRIFDGFYLHGAAE